MLRRHRFGLLSLVFIATWCWAFDLFIIGRGEMIEIGVWTWDFWVFLLFLWAAAYMWGSLYAHRLWLMPRLCAANVKWQPAGAAGHTWLDNLLHAHTHRHGRLLSGACAPVGGVQCESLGFSFLSHVSQSVDTYVLLKKSADDEARRMNLTESHRRWRRWTTLAGFIQTCLCCEEDCSFVTNNESGSGL